MAKRKKSKIDLIISESEDIEFTEDNGVKDIGLTSLKSYPKLLYVYWWNGHVFYLVSQDRQGLANAKSFHAILNDENKFLDNDQYLEEVVPANRGNDEIFGHMWKHHMLTMYTVMPTTKKARHILEKAQQVDMEKDGLVITLQVELNKMMADYEHARTTTPRKNYLYRKIRNYYIAINEIKLVR
jgi:hypothetical protein